MLGSRNNGMRVAYAVQRVIMAWNACTRDELGSI